MTTGADSIDQASDLAMATNEKHVQLARAAARLHNAPEQTQNADGSWPITECDCGVPLGLRAGMGKVRCVACQTTLERRARR